MDENLYWLGFSFFPGIGPKRFQYLLTEFGSAKDAWNAAESSLAAILGKKLTKEFIDFRPTFSLTGYKKRLDQKGVVPILLRDKKYPKLLSAIENPPFVLYVKGNPDFALLDKKPCVGIVGTRKITSYGRDVTMQFTTTLVASGCVIISGLAVGVDAVAHRTTIDEGGITIAVLGCGVDCCSPMANSMLYKSIIDSGGAIVSEFPLSAAPSIGSFPSRNRIIAGLSHVVLVTEGAEDSGALITASNAVLQQKVVFAVPGPITSQLSKGPNNLIQKGARLVTSAEEILKDLGIKGIKSIKGIKGNEVKGETEEEQRIIDLLQNTPLHFDEIVKQTGFDVTKIGILLSMMEVKGMIRQENNMYCF